tara:strand:+ start:91 stop:633 length:543 start_codon:yes stop_codon:yes gene_type:complete
MELIQIPGLTPDQQFTLMAWGIGGAFIALLVAGMTNRVVIFANGKDLMWTVSIFLAPVIGFVIAATLVPEGREFRDETSAVVVAGIGGVFALLSCVMTFILAIKHNGFFIGIILGIFKVMAALLAAVCAIGLLGKIFGEQGGSFASKMFALIFFGLLLWMIGKLINGDEVYARRGQIMPS